MTCIVGLVCGDDEVIIGAESRAVMGNQISSDLCDKIIEKRKFVIGCAGRMRMRDILENNFELPLHAEWVIDSEYLCDDFVSSVRECLESSKFSYAKEGISEFTNSMILFVYKSKLYSMDSAYGIIDHKDFTAIGSGREYALGSLETTSKLDLTPYDRVKMALDAACKFDIYCGGKYNIIRINKNGVIDN